VGPIAPDLLSIHSVTAKTEALLGSMRRSGTAAVATVDDFEVDILLHEALQSFTASAFRHRSLWALLRDDGELAETLLAYFEASLDVAECSKRMKLHKNTVYYRISKASRVTGLNFSDPHHSLVALLHIQEWAGKHKEHLGKK
jgi:DNA-binding PucR family transcriptional regulator